MSEKGFLRVDEVAEYLRCSQATVKNMIRDGRLRASKPNERYLIPRESVEKLLEKSRIRNE